MKLISLEMWPLLFMICLAKTAAIEEIVEVAEGLVQGTTMVSFSQRTFLAFRGIPYAEPPTELRRFKPPEPKAPWSGTLNATVEGSVCPQAVLATEEYIGDEDCLFLNLYTHVNATDNPVILWIHGGAFIEGHGGVSLGGPNYLMDHDIVLVTFNYRLGPFGFLSTGDSAIPGNYGLKDTLEVLRWIQRNIIAFGGNPGAVTAFGYSSGAAQAHYLTLSPLTKGLFHRVVFESGTALHKWAFKSSPLVTARHVAKQLNCPAFQTSTEIAECLRKESSEKIVRTLMSFPYWAVKLPLPYAPVVEFQEDKNDPPFLRAPPMELVQKGLVHKLPAITGVTAAESVDAPFLITQNKQLASEFSDHFKTVLLNDFISSDLSNDTVDKIKHFYFGEKEPKDATLEQLISVFSDCIFNYGSYRTAVAHSKATDLPVYVYLFSFQGRLSSIVKDRIHTSILGVTHTDDLFYVFRRGIEFPGQGPNTAEEITIKRITKLLTDFARTGDPTPNLSDLVSSKWYPIRGAGKAFRYLDIGSYLCMRRGPFFSDRMEFLDSVLQNGNLDDIKHEL